MSQHRKHPTCSFCGKPPTQVQHLIAGLTEVYICNECVTLCYSLVAGARPAEQETLTLSSRPAWWQRWFDRGLRTEQ